MFITYAIKSINRNYIYVGLTNDLTRRLNQHQLGENRTTRAYRPFILILKESFLNRIEARNREKYLKSGIGKELLKKIKI